MGLLLAAGAVVAYEASRIEKAGAPYHWIGLAVGVAGGVAMYSMDRGGKHPVLTGAGIGYALGEATRLLATAAREDSASST